MKHDRYTPISKAGDLSVFEFMSVGRNGSIKKRVVFAKTDMRGIYNLAFGNIRSDNSMDDGFINDNGDRNEILATVAQAVDIYTQRYPRRWIYFRGNTPTKTRLYRMVISIYWGELSQKFEIYADVDGKEHFIPFQRNMLLDGFLIRRRIVL
ncbi:MAG TPA: hypothetical protein VNU70_14190 [Puia sp.]|jgi:hypothetical protein|nr:hypothetical protein [Puia sp.]